MRSFKSFRQLGLLMKIQLLVLALVLSNEVVAAPGNGEDVLNRKISIAVEQKEVRTILSEISKLAEIKFVYSAQRIPCRKKVSLQAQDERLGDVLNSLLAPLEVLYYVSGNQIVLTKKAEEESLKFELKNVSADN